MITILDVKAALANLTLLRGRTPQMTEAERKDSGGLATLAPFRDGNIFSAKFSGDGAWERHPNGDELVQIVDGSATLHIMVEDGPSSYPVSAGNAHHRAPGNLAPLPPPRRRLPDDRHPEADRAPDRRPSRIHGRSSRLSGRAPPSRSGADAGAVTPRDRAVRDVVIGNRILAHEGVVDAYGHVSVRHPDAPGRFLLSRSRAPELVEPSDLMEFDLAGNVVGGDTRPPYTERFIHAAVYEQRADVQAVVHAHAEAVLPFTITGIPLRPVLHTASYIGTRLPVWDIRDRFGDTNLLVTNMDHGRDLARALGAERVVLMRGHGFSAVARSVAEVVRIAVYMPVNARILLEALRLGGQVQALSPGEVEAFSSMPPDSPAMQRAWEYWAVRAGCAELLGETT